MKGVVLLEALLAAVLGALMVAVLLNEGRSALQSLNRSKGSGVDVQWTCTPLPAGSIGSCIRGDDRYGVLIP